MIVVTVRMQKLQQKQAPSAGPSGKVQHPRRLGGFYLSGGLRRKEGKSVSGAFSAPPLSLSLSVFLLASVSVSASRLPFSLFLCPSLCLTSRSPCVFTPPPPPHFSFSVLSVSLSLSPLPFSVLSVHSVPFSPPFLCSLCLCPSLSSLSVFSVSVPLNPPFLCSLCLCPSLPSISLFSVSLSLSPLPFSVLCPSQPSLSVLSVPPSPPFLFSLCSLCPSLTSLSLFTLALSPVPLPSLERRIPCLP